jgi:Flp pilus assembly protein TadD
MTTRFKQRQVLFIISIALVAATLAAYEPIRHNGFVSYDDGGYITENPNVTGGITRESVIWAFTNSHMGNWHPLTMISHTLDCEIFGLNPLWHHFINVLFHILNALLIFWILTATTGAMWPSAFVAAVFALHPLQVESVAWASERKAVLSSLFWFLTIAVYIWYTKRPGIGRYILLFTVYALCIMTKPVVVTLPLVLLLLDYWPLERIRRRKTEDRGQRAGGASQKVSAGRLIVEKIPLLVLSGILSVITFVAQQSGGAVVTLERMPLDYRIANAFISYTKYIGKIIWPSQLAAFYSYLRANFSDANVAVCMLIFILISLFSIYLGRRRKYIVTGWLWYVGTLVPMIGLVQVGMQSMADRYMYIPMLGLLIIVAWAVKDLVFNRPRWKAAVSVLAAVALLSAVIVTRTQVRYWQNSMSLFENASKVTKNNHVAEKGYGSALFAAGRLDEAIVHLRNALQTHPGYLAAGNELGRVYLRQGKFNEAVACFNELLKLNKNSAELYYNLGIVLSLQKKYEEAIKHFAKVLELNPKYPDAHNNMGTALLAAGRITEAIKHLNEALRTDSNDVGLYENLGNAYVQSGKYDLAVQNWAKALDLKPNSTEVLNNMAWALATTGDVSVQDANKAVELAQFACELTGYKNPSFLDTLAAACAAAGRFADAVETARTAINLADDANQPQLKNTIQEHLGFYTQGKPYIDPAQNPFLDSNKP